MAGNFKSKIFYGYRSSPVLTLLIAANIVVGLLMLIFGILQYFGVAAIDPYYWLALPSDFNLFIQRPWTILTYMFSQVSFFHLLFNMLWLYWFGRVMLDAYSEKRLGLTYICGGLLGGAFYLIIPLIIKSLPHGAGLFGASASIMAVMTVAALKFPNRTFRLILFGDVKLKWIAIISIILIFLGAGGAGNVGGGLAHVGGIAAGLLIFFRRKKISKKPLRVKINEKKAKKAFEKIRTKNERLDTLLDKIRLSGYESLSKKERQELNQLSQELKTRK